MPLPPPPALIQPLFSAANPLVPAAGAPPMTPFSPAKAQLIGGLADAASTYGFLKRGKAVEGNAMYAGADNRPLPTALGVAGWGMGSLLAHLLAHASHHPAAAAVADLLTGAQGAHQLGLAAVNMQHLNGWYPGGSSEHQLNHQVLRAATQAQVP